MSAKIKSRAVVSPSKTAIAKLQAQAVKFHANIGNQLQKALAANPGGVSATFVLKIFIGGKTTESITPYPPPFPKPGQHPFKGH